MVLWVKTLLNSFDIFFFVVLLQEVPVNLLNTRRLRWGLLGGLQRLSRCSRLRRLRTLRLLRRRRRLAGRRRWRFDRWGSHVSVAGVLNHRTFTPQCSWRWNKTATVHFSPPGCLMIQLLLRAPPVPMLGRVLCWPASFFSWVLAVVSFRLNMGSNLVEPL